MRNITAVALCLFAASLSACGKTGTTNTTAEAPALAPMPPATPEGARHYTQADFDSKCFTYPNHDTMVQYQAFGLKGQAAVDYEYRNDLRDKPGGWCGLGKKPDNHSNTGQNTTDGSWVENAPANDMSHYGDALPGGKH